MKLFAIGDGPPSICVRMTLKALDLPYDLVMKDYVKGDNLTEEYEKMNPQREIPVLEDDGFYLSESVAIIQYLCDKYRPESPLYPKDPQKRALVNHRLYFNSNFYYPPLLMYCLNPLFYHYPRTEAGRNRAKLSLSTLETYLERSGTAYVAGEGLTVADFPLIAATMCMEAIDWDISEWPAVKKWYENFKINHPDLWKIAEVGLQMNRDFVKNPPDMSHINHHIHPPKQE